jgi:hypothetical protein
VILQPRPADGETHRGDRRWGRRRSRKASPSPPSCSPTARGG